MLKVLSVKTSYGKIKKLSPVKAAYIAGFIDGEGSISLVRNTKEGYRRLTVSVSNTDQKVLEWVKNSIGAGQVNAKCDSLKNDFHSTAYFYKIAGRQAFNLLAQICPYLKIETKRKRAELILKNYIKLTPRNGKYSAQILTERDGFIKKFFSIPYPGPVKFNPRKSRLIEEIIKT